MFRFLKYRNSDKNSSVHLVLPCEKCVISFSQHCYGYVWVTTISHFTELKIETQILRFTHGHTINCAVSFKVHAISSALDSHSDCHLIRITEKSNEISVLVYN